MRVQPKPLVVSFHTPDDWYTWQAERMAMSARAYGYEVHIEQVSNKGGWLQNVHYKPVFMRKMLDMFPNRPLLWLDADTEIVSEPALFESMDVLMAVPRIDWRLYNSRRMKHMEINSSVVYVRPCETTVAMMDEWCRRAKENYTPQWGDQEHLGATIALPQFAQHVAFLPVTYCLIFDMLQPAGVPVIKCWQASRKGKQLPCNIG